MKTKQILVATLVFLLLFSLTVSAKPIVKADEQYFDINTGLYILKGNVYIEVKNRIITAGQARVNMASTSPLSAARVSQPVALAVSFSTWRPSL